ncbi:MAG: hypothetical protein ACO23N_04780 [Opitutales bacterium]
MFIPRPSRHPRGPALVAAAAGILLVPLALYLNREHGKPGTLPAAEITENSPAPASTPETSGPARRPNQSQAESFATERGRSGLCLVALARATGDPAWLDRALAEHPEDPRVQLERWRQAKTPEEKAAAVAALRAADSDNPLGHYLATRQAFEGGDLGAVARLLVDASFAQTYSSYAAETFGETAEVFRASGLGEFDALNAAMAAGGVTDVGINLHQLGDDMGELQHVFVEMGYWDEADFMFERTLALGEQLQDGDLLIDNLVGVALQRKLLSSFDPATIVDLSGTTAAERLAQLEVESAELKTLWPDAGEHLRNLDEASIAKYRTILTSDGEAAAMRWLKERK